MKIRHLAVASLAAAALCEALAAQQPAAQQPDVHFSDPANLAGERISPRDGRELPIDQGARGLEQMVRRLNTRASVLNIVAHPDDEDGGMLTLCSRGLGARVADLSLTRGEGGQNAMTGDFEDALGLLRTQELLANDRYTGVSQMFGTEVDFGFSKTKAETFDKWTHQRVLYDAVRAIRIFRPLILTSTWIGGVTDGHGQHQVSGQIAQEAFLAAADPNVFPEMIREGILPWKPLRVYARVPHSAITANGLFDYATDQYVPAEFHNYVTGATSRSAPSADVLLQEGKTDPLLSATGEAPVSYLQFARRGLAEQKSQMGQGMRGAPHGEHQVAFHLYGDSTGAPTPTAQSDDLFTGIDTSVASLATLAPHIPGAAQPIAQLAQQIQSLTQSFNPAQPAAVAPALASALSGLNTYLATLEATSAPAEEKANLQHELRIKQAQLQQALALSLGLSLDATAPSAQQLQNTPLTVYRHARAKLQRNERSSHRIATQRRRRRHALRRRLHNPRPPRTGLAHRAGFARLLLTHQHRSPGLHPQRPHTTQRSARSSGARGLGKPHGGQRHAPPWQRRTHGRAAAPDRPARQRAVSYRHAASAAAAASLPPARLRAPREPKRAARHAPSCVERYSQRRQQHLAHLYAPAARHTRRSHHRGLLSPRAGNNGSGRLSSRRLRQPAAHQPLHARNPAHRARGPQAALQTPHRLPSRYRRCRS
ncbi:MAG: PIG-L family deacetylase [Acidobacteriaceae bacterium]|nr:PIG-L family deacetylase [Acidobacteriaceae bacterium]